MKKLLILSGLLLSVCLSFGQNLAKDITQDWYLNLRDSEHIPDTLTLNLYSNDPSVLPPHYRIWYYRKDMYVRVDIETRKGIWDPEEVPEHWKVVKSDEGERLIIKVYKNWVSKKRICKAVFTINPAYDNGKLIRIVLIRIKGKYVNVS